MNCGKHRRPSIRRPTAARQRYEQSRLSEKAETARNGATFAQLSAVRRRKSDRKRQPHGKTSPQRRKDRQARLSRQKRILPLPAHSGDPRGENPELCQHFPAKINFSPARSRQSMPPIPEEYKRLKGCGHNQRPDPSPHGGNASYESRIFAVHLLPATDSPRSGPDRQPPQLLPQPPQPALPASKVVRFSPNEGKRDYSVLFGGAATRIPLRRKDLRESRHYRHGLRPRTNERRMTDIEIYDCRGKSIFLREPVPNKRRIRP